MTKKRRKLDSATTIPNSRNFYEDVLIPLLELFATADDVFEEANAFDPSQIHHSLGRLYRTWLDTREHLDPEFNRDRYRHEMKKKVSPKKGRTPLGRKQRAKDQRPSSTGHISTSAKNQRRNGNFASTRPSRSASSARSGSSASGGQSRTQSLSACGAAWLIASGSASASGSRTKASARFRNGTA